MKRIFFLSFFLFFFLVGTLAISVYAEEAPNYNFGSMQASKDFSVKPGEEASVKLYFYNIYGNRPTHIKLSIAEKPKNWEVTVIPELRKVDYEVAGVVQKVDENLIVYPSNASNTIGTNTETIEWISSKVGYIGANFVTIKIKIPENEKIGVSEKIKINALAFWLGQTGSVALQQERDFEYSVTTTTEYYEKPYEPEKEANQTTIGKNIVSLFSGKEIRPVYMISTGFTLILLIILVILVILVRRKQIKKGIKEEIKILKPGKKRK